MSKAAELAALIANVNNGSSLSNKNFIINGNLSCFQRGTSFTSVANTAYHSDRFQLYMQNEASQYTVTQASDGPTGFANSLKLDVTTADASTASNEEVKLLQKIEGQNLQAFCKGTSDAKPMALSFYVKTNKTGVYVVELYDRDNSREISASYTVADSNWNRYEITFAGDTTGAFDDDTASSLEVSWWLVAGSATQGGSLNTAWRSISDGSSATGQVNFSDSTDNNWQITGVQLEIGKATAFEHESYETTLRKCLRYYERSAIGYGLHYSTSNSIMPVPYKVHKRVTPSSSLTNDSAGSAVGTSNNAGNYAYWTNQGANTAELIADAEL